ncbi:MAG: hypothetical protein R6X19_05085 [Kiritimatiellia bacterium]
MKTLVVFYSRTGRTRTAAQKLARLLNATVEELREAGVNRAGAVGYWRAGRDALMKRSSELEPVGADPATFDLVVLAGPVWAFTVCPALRSYLAKQGRVIRRAAFLCTQGGSGAPRAFAEMEALLGQPPAATLVLLDQEIAREAVDAEVEAFAKKVSAC